MPTILLVDDDVTLLERLATLLGEAGYGVLRANQVQYAEILLRERQPDLVLLDPDMSSGDGWVLLGASAAQLPIIVISGQGLEEDIVRGLDAGAVDYLPKPFGTNELLARVRTQLRAQARAASPAPAFLAAPEPPAAATGPTTPLVPPAPPAPARRRNALAPGDGEEPVFIPYGEEGRLVRDERPSPIEELSDIAQLPLGQRLHAARQRKRLTLVQAELETRPTVPMHYIQAMEEEKFSLLPRGGMAEELLRSYATYVGVDVPTALDEYRRLHYIAPIEPPNSLGGAPGPRRLPTWPISLAAALLAVVVALGAIWAYDSAGLTALAQRAGLIAPAVPTAAPTSAPTAAPTSAPTAAPTSAPTAAPTSAPRPTATTTITSTVAPSP